VDALAKLCFLGTSLIMLVVGARLLWVWRRTRQIPELVVGIAYALGVLGLFTLITAGALSREGREVFSLWIFGHAAVMVGEAALVIGVWRIFHPKARWAARTAAFGIGICGLCIAVGALRGEVEAYAQINAVNLLTTAAGVFSYGWVATAALRYTSQLQRRRRLGLADTLIVWRFRLWGVSGTAAAMVSLLSLYSAIAYQVGLSRVPWIFMAVQGLLILSSWGTWFAFFPPAFYRRLAAAREAQPAS
jgi:hypothetical protein